MPYSRDILVSRRPCQSVDSFGNCGFKKPSRPRVTGTVRPRGNTIARALVAGCVNTEFAS
ncbi:hypothetical protein CLIM01_07510 [Colletotrichum limetticola]|uniref:Uncharacterized protein n=1 Tax=Colletotrichum limetticola TaxID=1209924 RepID=A0ABQ9PUJ0_9PEZI|nr:hypothetical protein CLIM01_07510 [Colletotrichum limetticola]